MDRSPALSWTNGTEFLKNGAAPWQPRRAGGSLLHESDALRTSFQNFRKPVHAERRGPLWVILAPGGKDDASGDRGKRSSGTRERLGPDLRRSPCYPRSNRSRSSECRPPSLSTQSSIRNVPGGDQSAMPLGPSESPRRRWTSHRWTCCVSKTPSPTSF